MLSEGNFSDRTASNRANNPEHLVHRQAIQNQLALPGFTSLLEVAPKQIFRT